MLRQYELDISDFQFLPCLMFDRKANYALPEHPVMPFIILVRESLDETTEDVSRLVVFKLHLLRSQFCKKNSSSLMLRQYELEFTTPSVIFCHVKHLQRNTNLRLYRAPYDAP